jgi:hypothetical protein
MQIHLDCVVQQYSRRSRAYDWNWQSFDRVVHSHFVQDTPVWNSGQKTALEEHLGSKAARFRSVFAFVVVPEFASVVDYLLRLQRNRKQRPEHPVFSFFRNGRFCERQIYTPCSYKF